MSSKKKSKKVKKIIDLMREKSIKTTFKMLCEIYEIPDTLLSNDSKDNFTK